jgi:hypothetical protein
MIPVRIAHLSLGNNYNRGDFMGWDGWPFTRVTLVFGAAAFLLTFIQVTLNHYRQNFRDFSQWIPVIALPILALAALVVAAWNGEGPAGYSWPLPTLGLSRA